MVYRVSFSSNVAMTSSAPTKVLAAVYPMKAMWTTEAAVRAAPMVYSYKDKDQPHSNDTTHWR
jgi:hypothetical protein